MLAGYAGVSTLDQNPELQLDALSTARCERIFEDRASGARSDRPRLAEALDWMHKGDTLVVGKLDRLGRRLPQLVATVREIEERGISSGSGGCCSCGPAILVFQQRNLNPASRAESTWNVRRVCIV